MSTRWGLAIIAGLALVMSALGPGRAEAGTSVSVGVGFGAPVYAPPPVYYAPPGYYYPAPVAVPVVPYAYPAYAYPAYPAGAVSLRFGFSDGGHHHH